MAADDFGTPVEDVRLAASGQAVSHPALVWGAWAKGTAGVTMTLAVYDGFSTSDTLRFTLVSQQEGFAAIMFPVPLSFRTGIYLSKGAAATEVGVIFKALPEA